MASTIVKAYGATAATDDLKPLDIERRAVGTDDVKIDITFCGVCHSDIHTVRNDWKGSTYPVVPGHEIIGRVLEVGAGVTDFNEGDEVYGMAGGINGVDGALAEFMLVDALLMASKPKTLTMKQAAALPLVAITAYEALIDKMNVQIMLVSPYSLKEGALR